MSESPITFKFIIVGNSAVGKSCLLLRYDEGRFQPIHDVTVGVSFSIKMLKIDGQNIKVQIWDTAGQEIFKSITRSYYRDSACAIIVYDITDNSSFEKVKDWIHDVRNLAPPECLIGLFGNKKDLCEQRAISYEQGQELADRNGIMFFETSALTGENVETAFNQCINAVYSKNKKLHTPEDSKISIDNQGQSGNPCC